MARHVSAITFPITKVDRKMHLTYTNGQSEVTGIRKHNPHLVNNNLNLE